MRPLAAGVLGALLVAAHAGCTDAQPVATDADDRLHGSAVAPNAGADAATGAPRPKLYDTTADGFAQIDAALAEAKPAGKRVLLQFGAEWCGWCHRLHRLFESDDEIAAALDANYIVVLIDVDGDHNNAVDAKYGNPTQHGLPVLVVLDADGTQLATQDTAELEEGNAHDPAKVLAFLNERAPTAAPDSQTSTN